MLAVALALAVWAVSAASLVLVARGHLVQAERLLPVARDAVTAADLDTATGALDEARGELGAAVDALANPLLVPVRALPIIGGDLRAVTAVAQGAAAVSEVGAEVLGTLEALPGGLGALAPADGAFPVDAIEALAPPLRRTADAAADALREIEAAPGSGWLTPVSDARTRVLELLGPVATQTETAAQVATQLPPFLGADGPRTYLFGASTPAALGGTGGFIGSVALMRVDDGRPEFGTFQPADDLPVLAPDALPAPVAEDAERWSRYGGTGDWLTLNRTPHFPAAARAMEQLWEATQGGTVDGMIVADPFALEALLDLVGPAEVPGYGVTLDADSVVDYVANDAYATFGSADERKALLGAVSAGTLERFLEGGGDLAEPGDLVTRLGELVAGGHLLAHADDTDVQHAFSRAGIAGELRDPAGDLVSVTVNSGTASKVDYYAERRLEHEVTLLEDGATRTELTVEITNDAPTSGEPAYVIGPNNPTLEAGDNLVNVSVHVAKDAAFTETPSATEGLPAFTETELGHTVHDGWAKLASGETVERRYRWRTPDAWELTPDGEVVYEVLLQGQTVIRPTQLTLRVRIPDGFEVLDVPDGAQLEGDSLAWSGTNNGQDVTLPVRLGPTGH